MQIPQLRARRWPAALVACAVAVGTFVAAAPAHASPTPVGTSAFRGVNWADPRDNYANGPVVPSELSTSDDYATTYRKAVAVLRGFRAEVGANTVRLPVNPYSVGTAWWRSYRAAIKAASDLGFKVVLAYWEGTGTEKNGMVDNPPAWWSMWRTLTRLYRTDSNIYFEPMNEPFGYTAQQWTDLTAQWLDTFSAIPRGRVLIDGTGYADHVAAVCSDPRLDGALLALHDYGFWGTKTYDQWMADLHDRIAGCASRTVLDEFGVPMTTGIDYNGSTTAHDPATNNYIAFLQAATDTVRSLHMGSVYWPGLRTGDTYSLTSAVPDNGRPVLTVNNVSGLDRVHWGWGD